MNRQDLKANGDENTTFEFELKTEGVDVTNGMVSFVIIGSPFNYEFPCKHVVDFRYSVVIPKTLKLESKSSYMIRVVAEGFLFEPAGGELTFINKDAVKATVKVEEPAKPVTPIAPTKDAVIQINQDAAESFSLDSVDVEKIIEQRKNRPTAPRVESRNVAPSSLDNIKPKPIEPIIPKEIADERIRAILDEENQRRNQEELHRRESSRRELAERQQQIVKEAAEKKEKQSKIKEITKEFL